MRLETVATFTARLYLSGPIEVAKQIIRAECLREGLCVTVEPLTFIYTGGEEAGYVVGLVNYPRFPTAQAALTDRARDLMRKLLDGTHQHSALLVTPELTEWITKREPDIAGVLESQPAAGSREAAMVVLERDGSGTPTVWCDPEIADLVGALNAAGIRTVASCSGHGERDGSIVLKDGRELMVRASGVSGTPRRQYFYRVAGCPAVDGKDPACICWHDEGTGPWAQAKPGDERLEWRTAGVQPSDGGQQP